MTPCGRRDIEELFGNLHYKKELKHFTV